ncbi:MAG: OmpH family outer membrane protein [Bacteroidales bacterium]|nr:OmpH family outer membrane protein [Bacteroidales bacterium]
MEENNINNNELNQEIKENVQVSEEKITETIPTIPAEQKQKTKGRNYISICAIGISLIAIALSLFNMIGGKSCENEDTNTKKVAKTIQKGDLKVAYINTDTILAKYDMAIEMQKALEAKQKQAESSLKSAQASLEKDYADYMKNGDKLTLTQQKEKEKSLQQRMQNLQQMPAKLQQDLQQEQMAQNKKLLDAVYAFVKDYNAKHDKYNIILSRSYSNSPTLYMDEGMEITDEIVKGLNEEYKEYKKK